MYVVLLTNKWNCIYLVCLSIPFFSSKEKKIISKHFGSYFLTSLFFFAFHLPVIIFFKWYQAKMPRPLLLPVSRFELLETLLVKAPEGSDTIQGVWLTDSLPFHNISVTLWRYCRNSVTTTSWHNDDSWINEITHSKDVNCVFAVNT